MPSFNELSIGVSGNLKLTVTDAVTGKVLRVDEGPNMILNTGIEDICHLLAGDTTVPTDLLAGQLLYQSSMAIPRIPLYGQFGVSSISPASTDASKFDNGTLDKNASSPDSSVASEIIKSIAYFPITLIQSQSTSGNATPGTGPVPVSTSTATNNTVPVAVSNPSYINNQVTVQFTLEPNQGNGIGGTDTTYREVVLMSKIVDNPVQYRWFARRVFGDIIKNPTTIITAEWTFTFIIVRA
jgi:hypothetical protein